MIAGDRPVAYARVEAPVGQLSLRKNFSWLSVGRFIFAATQWGTLAVLAKVSTAQTVGEFTLALAISAPIIGFANLGLRQAQATDVRGNYRFGHYRGLRSVAGLGALLVIAGIAMISGYGAGTATTIALVGLASVIEMQSEIFYGLFQSRERLDYVARSLMLRGPLSMVLLGLGVVLTGQLAVGVVGRAAAALVVFWLHDLRIGRLLTTDGAGVGAEPRATAHDPHDGVRPIWDSKTLARLAWQVLPLGVVSVLASLQIMVPRYFIVEQLGLEQLGYFAVMIYVLVAVNRVVNALGTSATTRLARLYANRETRGFVILLMKMAGVGAFLGCVGLVAVAVAGREILTILYTADYAGYADVFVLIMAAALLRYVATLLGFGITAARRFRIQAAQQVLAVTAALTASYWLIKPYGLHGAAFATIITFTVQLMSVVMLNVWSIRQLRSDAAA
jgi:O-antigen/teichoic acid export membrane protein